MQQLNWFEADIKCWDGVGMPVDFIDLPFKARKQIVATIMQGHMCGSFPEYIDEEKLAELNPDFVIDLLDVANMQKEEIVRREATYKEQDEQ